MALVAVTRDVSPGIQACELTHLERATIDLPRAREQHEAYRALLSKLGCRLVRLAAEPDYPDSVFVEDVAVVIGETIVLTRPGAAPRRGEVDLIEPVLAPFASLARITAPAILDGGDVLVQGRDIFVGVSTRTNRAGIDQLAAIAGPMGFNVRGVEVTGCLHLKSAATSLGPETVLLNPAWIDATEISSYQTLSVDETEPYGTNALRIGDTVVYSTAFPRTAEKIRAAGFTVETVDNSELAKAEGALTCCSLIIDEAGGAPAIR